MNFVAIAMCSGDPLPNVLKNAPDTALSSVLMSKK